MKLLQRVVLSSHSNNYLVHMWHHSVLKLNKVWFQRLSGLVATMLIGQFVIKFGESVEDGRKTNSKYIDKVVQKKEKHHHKLNWVFKNGNIHEAKRVKTETALGIHYVTKKLWFVEDGGWRDIESLEQMVLTKNLRHS